MYLKAIVFKVYKTAIRNLKSISVLLVVSVYMLTRLNAPESSISFSDVELLNPIIEDEFDCDIQKLPENGLDPRLVAGNWLKVINRGVQDDTGVSVPFSWQDLLTIPPFFGTCNSLFKSMGISEDISEYCYQQTNEGQKMVITKGLNVSATEKNLKLFGGIHLLTAPIPHQIMFLLSNTSVIVPTHPGHINSSCYINFKREIRAIEVLSNTLPISKHHRNQRIKRTKEDKQVKQVKSAPITNLTQSDFLLVPQALSPVLLNSLAYQLSIAKSKYFNEPKIKGGGHFDWRFFQTLHYSDYERITYLQKLTRAWFKFASYAGLKTWAAHGTLLGWYWNGMNLPWDNDIDVQITMNSLLELAEKFNQTLVVDSELSGQFLIDVNIQIFDRSKSNGNNVIDARFIDIRTGLYIDITALSFTDCSKRVSINKKESLEFNKLLDPEYVDNERSQTLLKSDLHKKMFDRRAQLVNSKNIFNCKNNHFYLLDELQLVPVLFEGIPSHVPRGYKEMLKREYPKGIYYNVYNKHKWDPRLRVWVKEGWEEEGSVYGRMASKMTWMHKQNMYYGGHYLQEIEGFVHPWYVREKLNRISM